MTPTEALAEALHTAWPCNGSPHWTDGRDEPSDIETHRAAAILAALPPDWCGHEDQTDWIAALEVRIETEKAEIDRLRRIEEAARKRVENGHDINCRCLMPSAGRPHRCDCGQSGLERALKVKS